jgi:hypothetical protein
MLKRLSIIGIVGALGVTSAGVTMALSAASITTPETIVLHDETVKERFVDVGKHGVSPGDTFMFVDTLTDETDGSRVGTARGQCTFQVHEWGLCQVGAIIGDRGQVFLEGVVRLTVESTPIDLSITGGTGEFDNVRGSAHVEPISEQEARVTLDLLP